MTIVAAVKDHEAGTVLLGADRVNTIHGYISMPMRTTKLLAHYDWVLGVCGSPRIWTLLHHWEPSGKVDETSLTDELAAVLWAGEHHNDFVKDEYEKIGGSVILAWRDRLFWLGADLAVVEVASDYWAIGAGDEIALGAMHATASIGSERRLRSALEAAADWVGAINPPFDVMSTSPG